MRLLDRTLTTRTLGASALLGVASGMRSTAGLAMVIARGTEDLLPSALRHRIARPAATIAVAAELVLDKLPFTGSRLAPEGLAGRLVFAGAAGALIARRDRAPMLPVIVVAAATAGASAKVAHDARQRAAAHLPDALVALVEDAASLGIADLAIRL